MPVPITIDTFESLAIPLAEWNHRAHVTVAYLYLRDLPFDQATARMRRGLGAILGHFKIEETPTQGYHETLTLAWMRVIAAMMNAYGPCDGPDAFLEQHPHLTSRYLLRLYYTRDRIMSAEARRAWVEPDLAPLPRIADSGQSAGS
jgi:hypothetical protein